ncbi:hypothetical protein [Streptomyces sp. CB03238]|uniref:hypothetical protein n=1 Tax=Streptomyces sp. CB03238 TaxID=1907777 RepID=UPI000A11559B|nr:hypothetical protein [Streptomyces sp. CB03238]ORT59722.1 hypothetical protein BKD26_12575 [Streptomyces sp. CB03238]
MSHGPTFAWRLVDDDDDSVIAEGPTADGLFADPPPPVRVHEAEEAVPMRLLGGVPGAALLKGMERDDDFEVRGWLELFDRTGRPMRSTLTNWYVTSWEPSSHGHGLVNLTVDCDEDDRPPLAARRVYDLWADGPPRDKNLWTELGADGRREWLRLALDNHTGRAQGAPAGGTYHLDGRDVTDETDFSCALGEAVNGPGAKAPFTLVWHDAHVARRCLGQSPLVRARPTFEELVDLLVEQGVEVVLA